MLRTILRALRLPFTSASALPFIFGSLITRDNFRILPFILGLIAAVSTHLSANLMNDYADAKSGADNQDRTFYGFFGGSKLIQEGIFSQVFYLKLAVSFALIAVVSVLAICLTLKRSCILTLYLFILFLGWSYSHKPLQLSYRRLGEPVIFLLFGPALVMGGYFIQTGIFPDLKSFLLSSPFGFFTTAILFANEVPDYPQDKAVAKMTWVSIVGMEKSYALYFVLMALGFLSILLNFFLGYLGVLSLGALFGVIPMFKAAKILKEHYIDKMRLIFSSKLTIAIQTSVSLLLIGDILCKR